MAVLCAQPPSSSVGIAAAVSAAAPRILPSWRKDAPHAGAPMPSHSHWAQDAQETREMDEISQDEKWVWQASGEAMRDSESHVGRSLFTSLMAPFMGGRQRPQLSHRGRDKGKPVGWRPGYNRHPGRPRPSQPASYHPDTPQHVVHSGVPRPSQYVPESSQISTTNYYGGLETSQPLGDANSISDINVNPSEFSHPRLEDVIYTGLEDGGNGGHLQQNSGSFYQISVSDKPNLQLSTDFQPPPHISDGSDITDFMLPPPVNDLSQINDVFRRIFTALVETPVTMNSLNFPKEQLFITGDLPSSMNKTEEDAFISLQNQQQQPGGSMSHHSPQDHQETHFFITHLEGSQAGLSSATQDNQQGSIFLLPQQEAWQASPISQNDQYSSSPSIISGQEVPSQPHRQQQPHQQLQQQPLTTLKNESTLSTTIYNQFPTTLQQNFEIVNSDSNSSNTERETVSQGSQSLIPSLNTKEKSSISLGLTHMLDNSFQPQHELSHSQNGNFLSSSSFEPLQGFSKDDLGPPGAVTEGFMNFESSGEFFDHVLGGKNPFGEKVASQGTNPTTTPSYGPEGRETLHIRDIGSPTPTPQPLSTIHNPMSTLTAGQPFQTVSYTESITGTMSPFYQTSSAASAIFHPPTLISISPLGSPGEVSTRSTNARSPTIQVLVLPYKTVEEPDSGPGGSRSTQPTQRKEADEVSVYLVRRENLASEEPGSVSTSGAAQSTGTGGSDRHQAVTSASTDALGTSLDQPVPNSDETIEDFMEPYLQVLGSLAPPPSSLCQHGFCDDLTHDDNK
nr:LOW QUALITY PROTEIN: uncharacterized protein LOC128703492 [Cherax quadricarinatus]